MLLQGEKRGARALRGGRGEPVRGAVDGFR